MSDKPTEEEPVITAEQAVESMYKFVRDNLKGVDNLRQDGNTFSGKRDGIDFILMCASGPVRPVSKFLADVEARSQDDTMTSLLMLRSTTQYDGKLLRQLKYHENGKNYFYANKKNILLFEQIAVDLFGNPVHYYNPQRDSIESISISRFKQIPDFLASQDEEVMSRRKDMRKTLHVEESRREYWRVINIVDEIKSPFTLDTYDKDGIALARIGRYDPKLEFEQGRIPHKVDLTGQMQLF